MKTIFLKSAHGLGDQPSMDYALVLAALAFALGIGMLDNNSVFSALIEVFKAAFEKLGYSISLPR